jgi:small subunit ribosomal protein S16
MLTIRYLRSGRANSAFFRIVLTEKSKPCDSGFIKILGWYDPNTKKVSLENETILSWVDKGASVSNSVARLLIAHNVKHKNIKFVPDAPKEKKGKKNESETPKTQPQPKDNVAETESSVAEKADDKLDEKTTEKEPEKIEKELPAEEEKPDKLKNISKPESAKEKK